MSTAQQTLELANDVARCSFAPAPGSASLPPVLDACCSIRAFWFDKADPRAVFVDKRKEKITRPDSSSKTGERVLDINPDIVADFSSLPFPDNSFALVVFDPPHFVRNTVSGWNRQHYGNLAGDWREMLRSGFAECFRVLRPEGTLIFKWCESSVTTSDILKLTPHKPLFGHPSGKRAQTQWVAFLKPNAAGQATPAKKP